MLKDFESSYNIGIRFYNTFKIDIQIFSGSIRNTVPIGFHYF